MGRTSRVLELQDLVLDLYGEGESLRREVQALRDERNLLSDRITYLEAELDWLRLQMAQQKWAIDHYRTLLNK